VAGPAIQDASESDLSKEELLERVLRFVPSDIKLRRPELRPGVVPRPKLACPRRGWDPRSLFERFTERARQVVVRASS